MEIPPTDPHSSQYLSAEAGSRSGCNVFPFTASCCIPIISTRAPIIGRAGGSPDVKRSGFFFLNEDEIRSIKKRGGILLRVVSDRRGAKGLKGQARQGHQLFRPAPMRHETFNCERVSNWTLGSGGFREQTRSEKVETELWFVFFMTRNKRDSVKKKKEEEEKQNIHDCQHVACSGCCVTRSPLSRYCFIALLGSFASGLVSVCLSLPW